MFKDNDKIFGYVHLFSAIWIFIVALLGNYTFIAAFFIQLMLVEIYLQPVKRILNYIHKEIYFYQDKIKRRLKYQIFKLDVKLGQLDNFERRAKDLVK